MSSRLGYLLFDTEGAHLKHKCADALTPHQLKILEDAQSVISCVYEVIEAYDCFRLNLEDFVLTASNVLEVTKAQGAKIVSDPGWLLRATTKFRQRLSNILYSFPAMLDVSRRRLSASFGKKSVQLELFEKLISAEFDTCFSHRFFYKLRNYSTHSSLPNLDIHFLRLPLKGGAAPDAELRVEISKTVLLNSPYKKGGPILTPDLEADPDEINIAEAMKQLGESVIRIFGCFLLCYEAQLQNSGKVLWSACFVTGVPESGKLVTWDGTRVTSQDYDGCRVLGVEQFNDCWRQLQAVRAQAKI